MSTSYPEIQHLDFDPDDRVETDEKPEKAHACQLLYRHPYDHKNFSECGRAAAVKVNLKKPCGHSNASYWCGPCWSAVENGTIPTLLCYRDKTCMTSFKVKPAIQSWERL